ncbi:MAG TPA: superinfection immunity protein [Terriglobia bacterium]|nr:superinfection immunity protein [Terriglobia bacterium]
MSTRKLIVIAIILVVALVIGVVLVEQQFGSLNNFLRLLSEVSSEPASSRTEAFVRFSIGVIMLLVLAALSLFLYFLPSITAKRRKKINYRAIFTLNLLAGWTFVGWVIAMVWATTVDAPPPTPKEVT